MLLDVPRQLGGDVGDKVAAGPQTVIVAPHPELAVLPRRKASDFILRLFFKALNLNLSSRSSASRIVAHF